MGCCGKKESSIMRNFKDARERSVKARAAYRAKNWSDEKNEAYNEFLGKLKADFVAVKNAFLDMVVEKVAHAQNSGDVIVTVPEFARSMDSMEGALQSGVKPRTLFTGFWDTKTKRHDLRQLWDAGIDNALAYDAKDLVKARVEGLDNVFCSGHPVRPKTGMILHLTQE